MLSNFNLKNGKLFEARKIGTKIRDQPINLCQKMK